jgi:hypothetical protein
MRPAFGGDALYAALDQLFYQMVDSRSGFIGIQKVLCQL